MADVSQLSNEQLMALAGMSGAKPARRQSAYQDLQDELGGDMSQLSQVAPAMPPMPQFSSAPPAAPAIAQPQMPSPDLSQMSDEELMAHAGITPLQPSKTAAPQVQDLQAAFDAKKAGFIDRVKNDYAKRVEGAQKAADAYVAGQQTLPETILQHALNGGAGLGSDVIGEALTSAGRGLNTITFGGAGKVAENVLGAVANSPLGDAARYVGDKYSALETQYPRAMRNVDAAGNALGIASSFIPIKEGVSVARAAGKTVDEIATSPAVVKAAKAVATGAEKAVNTKKIIPNSEEIRSLGSQLFKQAENEGGVIAPQVADKFRDKVMNTLNLEGEAKIFASNPTAQKIAEQIGQFKGQPLNFETAKAIDEHLGDLAYDTMDTFGKLDSNGKKFLDLQRELRDAMDTLPNSPTIKEARKYWSASLKMQDVERILKRADGKEQPVTVIKNGFNALLNRGDKLKGYSPEEIKAIQKAAKTGIVTDAVKLAGSGLVPIGMGITGAIGGPVGAAIGAGAGFAVQQGSKAIGVARQTSRANSVSEAIAKNAGLLREEKRVQIPGFLKKTKAVADQSPQEMKLLPAPVKKEEFVAGRDGIRKATSEEVSAAEAARKRASDLGITPDVRKSNFKNEVRAKTNPVMDRLEKEFSEKKAAQIEQMYKNAIPSIKAKIGKIINEQDKAGIERGDLGELIIKALREGKKKEPLKITVRPSNKGTK